MKKLLFVLAYGWPTPALRNADPNFYHRRCGCAALGAFVPRDDKQRPHIGWRAVLLQGAYLCRGQNGQCVGISLCQVSVHGCLPISFLLRRQIFKLGLGQFAGPFLCPRRAELQNANAQ